MSEHCSLTYSHVPGWGCGPGHSARLTPIMFPAASMLLAVLAYVMHVQGCRARIQSPVHFTQASSQPRHEWVRIETYVCIIFLLHILRCCPQLSEAQLLSQHKHWARSYTKISYSVSSKCSPSPDHSRVQHLVLWCRPVFWLSRECV
jgi:hypothetical protein